MMSEQASKESPSIEEYNHIFNLRGDPGPCGQILSKVEDWILRAAGFREDTWDFLLGVRDLSEDVMQFCRAAKSARVAWLHIARTRYLGMSISHDLVHRFRELQKAGKARKAEELARQITLGGHEWFLASAIANHARSASVKTEIEAELKRRARRVGGGTIERRKREKPKAVYPMEESVVHRWLHLPEGEPGYCFFSKEAIAEVVDRCFCGPEVNISRDTVKYWLRGLKLKQAEVRVRRVRFVEKFLKNSASSAELARPDQRSSIWKATAEIFEGGVWRERALKCSLPG